MGKLIGGKKELKMVKCEHEHIIYVSFRDVTAHPFVDQLPAPIY